MVPGSQTQVGIIGRRPLVKPFVNYRDAVHKNPDAVVGSCRETVSTRAEIFRLLEPRGEIIHRQSAAGTPAHPIKIHRDFLANQSNRRGQKPIVVVFGDPV